MSYDVRHYRLPEDASPADRATLAIFKVWIVWLRPVLFVTVLMAIVSGIVGTFIAKTGGYVAVWSPANYSAAVEIGNNATSMPTEEWIRGIVAQAISVLVAAASAWLLLRRTIKPAAVAVVSGLLVVATHLSMSNQWGLQPIVQAPSGYQAAALLTLWSLPIVAGALGTAIERTRSRERSSETAPQ